MSQYDFGTINPNEKSGSQLALDLNGFRDAVNSGHKGAERPTYAQAGMQWIREVSTERWDLMLYDGESDTVLRSVNPATNELIKLPTSDIAGLDDTLALTVRKDTSGSTGAAILPAGTPGQRPGTPVNGMIRYNSTTEQFEGYRSGAWGPISSAPTDAGDLWAYQPLGVPIPVFTHLTGITEPPTNKDYRYLKLTAADSYNSGILKAESVTGAAPLVQATGVINLAGSPFNGKTVRLMNTEERVVRGGVAAGVLLNDQYQGHRVSSVGSRNGAAYPFVGTTLNEGTALGPNTQNGLSIGTGSSSVSSGTEVYNGGRFMADDTNGAPRVGMETRAKSISAVFYLRIK